jgi:prevent-host-death family protein
MTARLSVGAYEAKTRLAALLDEVEKGHAVTITRHGQPVAELIPVDRGLAQTMPADILESFRALRKGRKLGLPLKQAIEEGRR